ncbi:MAG: type II toxin-antitoxin system death-on-curing family toxin [Candidatus Tritonobacter lacicola]|nr:type II toxin-antitoxin system death-on-curing family toxin [Candidatus Tritonobacter lacicola]
MRYLSISEVLELHERLIASSGGATGIRDLGALESAVSQPHATFAQQNLYPDMVTKAAALCFSLVMNHPFVDGNKRVGHAAMETFLILNGSEIDCSIDEQERVILDLAAGSLDRDGFTNWVKKHTTS